MCDSPASLDITVPQAPWDNMEVNYEDERFAQDPEEPTSQSLQPEPSLSAYSLSELAEELGIDEYASNIANFVSGDSDFPMYINSPHPSCAPASYSICSPQPAQEAARFDRVPDIDELSDPSTGELRKQSGGRRRRGQFKSRRSRPRRHSPIAKPSRGPSVPLLTFPPLPRHPSLNAPLLQLPLLCAPYQLAGVVSHTIARPHTNARAFRFR